jgi:polyhydroxybutyrate depolymerase
MMDKLRPTNRPRVATILQALALLSSLVVLCCGATQIHRPPVGDYSGKLQVQGRARHYSLHIPRLTRDKPAAVIVLHGALSNAWSVGFDSDMSGYADRQGFIVAYPCGTGLGPRQLLFWNAGACCGPAKSNQVDDVAFVRELIELLKTKYNADPDRIYVAGASNGGMMAYRLAVELSDQIAAIGSVDGCMFPQTKVPTTPVSVIEFHGTADPVIPYKGGTGTWFVYKVRSVPPAAETMAYWVAHNHCKTTPVKEEEADGVTRETYDDGDGGSAVALVTIKGVGHTWPGGRGAFLRGDKEAGKVKATAEMLKFFWQHPRACVSVDPGHAFRHPDNGL